MKLNFRTETRAKELMHSEDHGDEGHQSSAMGLYLITKKLGNLFKKNKIYRRKFNQKKSDLIGNLRDWDFSLENGFLTRNNL